MATGDMNNNVRKLQVMLKKINYEKDADIKGITQGQSNAFFPIYHYLFVNYSQPFSQKIMEMNIELYGKTDLRFIEFMYRILRDMFNFKPPITKEQFFGSGFIEMKVIMCTDIMRLVFEKHQLLKPKQVKPFKLPGPFAYGSKPVKGGTGSANSSADGTCSTRGTDSTEKRGATKKPQVVNELRNPKNKYTASKFNTSAPHIPTNSSHRLPSPIHERTKDISHSSPIVKGEPLQYSISSEDAAGELSLEPIDIIAMTPGASSQPRCQSVPEMAQVTDSRQAIDIIAMTPGASSQPRCRSIPELAQVTDSMVKSLEVDNKLSTIDIKNVMERLAVIEARLNTSERSLINVEQRCAQKPTLTPSQLENLLARQTILENKLAIMDSELQLAKAAAPSPPTEGQVGAKTRLAQGDAEGVSHSSAENDPSYVLSPISVLARDNVGLPQTITSPDMSLVMRAEEDAENRSSTPEEKMKKDASLSIHFVDTPTCNQAKRVFEMIRETEHCFTKDETEPPEEL